MINASFSGTVSIFLFYSLVSVISFSFTESILKNYQLLISKCVILFIYYVFMILTVISHYKAMTTDNSVENNITTSLSSNSFCKKCNKDRPERSHHCSCCDKCILQMDHHCPWISNCVGEKNLKYFYLLLLYAILGCLTSCCFTLSDFITMMLTKSEPILNYTTYPFYYQIFYDMQKGSPAIACLFSGLMGISLLLLALCQLSSIWYGMTAIEMLLYKDDYTKCPYYSNNVKMNVQTIFGENVYEWFIPIEAHRDSSIEENVDNNYRAMR